MVRYLFWMEHSNSLRKMNVLTKKWWLTFLFAQFQTQKRFMLKLVLYIARTIKSKSFQYSIVHAVLCYKCVFNSAVLCYKCVKPWFTEMLHFLFFCPLIYRCCFLVEEMVASLGKFPAILLLNTLTYVKLTLCSLMWVK